jgi:hypothetical protein
MVPSHQNIICTIFRLDFDQFNIAGPESVDNMCNNDQFIVAGGNPAPAICGINNGNHSEYTATSRYTVSRKHMHCSTDSTTEQ